MTEEEKLQMRSELSLLTPYKNGFEWYLVCGRPTSKVLMNGQVLQIDPRFDIVSGPEKSPHPDLPTMIKSKTFKQIVHFHPESPRVWEKNENYEKDVAFLFNSPFRTEKLLDEIDRLELEIKKLKGESNGI